MRVVTARLSQALRVLPALLMLLASQAAAQPDPRVQRKLIDELIATHKLATVGVLQQAATLSINYGAPTYNAGNIDGCRRFYRDTIRALLRAYRSPRKASAAARPLIAALSAAHRRAAKLESADAAAWALRYGFDRIALSAGTHGAEILELMGLGDQYFKRAQFEEAESAFAAALALLDEIEQPGNLAAIEISMRLPSLARGHALFAMGRFKQAAAALSRGLHYVPDWPEYKLDRRSFHGVASEYDGRLSELERAAAALGANAEIHFLLGYEYFMARRHDQAQAELLKALRGSPDHRGAKIFMGYLRSAAGKSI